MIRLLERGRVVTLTGVGGVGKTRMALRIARAVQPRFPDGVWFVELSSLREPELLGHTVCSVLRVAQQAGRPPMEVLAGFLGRRHALLVLDTCEHLAEECAAMLVTLLEAAPGLRALVTSRRVLGMPGETCYEVVPLPIEPSPLPVAPLPVEPSPLPIDPRPTGAVPTTWNPTPAGSTPPNGAPADGAPADGVRVNRVPVNGATAKNANVDGASVGDGNVDRRNVDGAFADEGLGSGGAVALFVERAGRVVPGFVATPEVAVICERLDGIPLAIELAAVRLRTLSVEQIMGRIDDRFGLLLDGDRGGQPRHRTMRTAIGWSHELCEPLERLLWARLSVFAGDFDLEAAQAVCADPGGATGLYPGQVPELLRALADKSILRRDGAGAAARFRMLGTVRDYGADWLRELGERDLVRRRHRDHYLDLARRFDAAWFGPDQVAWYARMRRELPNLRSALDLCHSEQAEHPVGLELAGRLAYFWMACGFIAEGRHHLRRALALSHAPSAGRSRALWVCAWLADFQGDLDEANDLATECLSQAFSRRDREAAGWGTICCANTGLHWGYVTEVLPMYERARRAHEEGGDHGAGVAVALAGEAYVLRRLGRYEQALACLRGQRALCDAYGDIWLRSTGDWVRSLIELDRGDPHAAERFGRASLRDKRALHDSLGIAAVVRSLAGAAAGLGDMERAARLLGVGDLVEDAFGLRIGRALPNGITERTEARAMDALGERTYRDAVTRGRELDLDRALVYALTGAEPSRT
ncbi:LuxR family transcriptional regulator [Sphaerisporangium siamense]|uniref:Putative ATPase n=1 Tax=Sphaerisporangium siamense TaxID=795645 RepID=A0A7W7DE31_9ACTN|nr:LuxR family transcriptional regulator [Sphaerisporangium siamense]MBB4705118.1 putative ATPase [Sphaerisporangium siamense]